MRQLELGDDAARALGVRVEPVRLALVVVRRRAHRARSPRSRDRSRSSRWPRRRSPGGSPAPPAWRCVARGALGACLRGVATVVAQHVLPARRCRWASSPSCSAAATSSGCSSAKPGGDHEHRSRDTDTARSGAVPSDLAPSGTAARLHADAVTLGYDQRVISRDLSVADPGRVVHGDRRAQRVRQVDAAARRCRGCCKPTRRPGAARRADIAPTGQGGGPAARAAAADLDRARRDHRRPTWSPAAGTRTRG